jgi:hypothetical protein
MSLTGVGPEAYIDVVNNQDGREGIWLLVAGAMREIRLHVEGLNMHFGTLNVMEDCR